MQKIVKNCKFVNAVSAVDGVPVLAGDSLPGIISPALH